MKLAELHIRHATSGAPCHCDSITGGSFGVGGVQICSAGSAGGQNHGARRQRDHPPSGRVKHVSAHAAGLAPTRFWMTDQIDGNVVFKQRATALSKPRDERRLHRSSGGIR